MDWWRPDLVVPAAGALAAGAAIGFEREYSGRAAGLRTHALLSLGSALLMLMAVNQREWLGPAAGTGLFDPLRIVQAVLTGIGFLGGGVIFREGFSVRGLTTAASLWVSAALGLLFGSGFYPLAVGGTVAALALLALVKRVEGRLPREQVTDLSIRYRRGEAPSEAEFAAFAHGFRSRAEHLAYRLTDDGAALERTMVLKTRGRLDAEPMARALIEDPRVLAFSLDPRND